MARIRTIKPEFWSSEQIVELSPTARLLFIGLWNFCDDAGNHPASPRTLKMQVFPGDDFTAEQIAAYVAEMIAARLIVEYQAEGKNYWHVTGWHHQKIEKPNYKYPPAPDQKIADQSSNGSRPFDPVRECNSNSKGKEKEVSVNAHAHEENFQKQKNQTPTPADIYAAIEAHVNTDHGLRELVGWKKQAAYSDKKHGPTTGELTKFIAYYLDRIRASPDPVAYYRDHFAAWLVRATEYNRPKPNAAQYTPPPNAKPYTPPEKRTGETTLAATLPSTVHRPPSTVETTIAQ